LFAEDVVNLKILRGKNLVWKVRHHSFYFVLFVNCVSVGQDNVVKAGRKTSDPYVVAELFGDSSTLKRSSTVPKDLNPDWGGEFLYQNLRIPEKYRSDPFIRLNIIDDDSDKSGVDDPMGCVTIPLKLLEADKPLQQWFPVENCEGCDDATGEIEVWVVVGKEVPPDAEKGGEDEAAKEDEAPVTAAEKKKNVDEAVAKMADDKKKKAEEESEKQVVFFNFIN
jgi:hypothetical protein